MAQVISRRLQSSVDVQEADKGYIMKCVPQKAEESQSGGSLVAV